MKRFALRSQSQPCRSIHPNSSTPSASSRKAAGRSSSAAREAAVTCEWPECQNKGSHRAPKGRDNQREYWHFCLNHVREYNQSYNFFSGMNADAVARYQKDALTGHRPTWKMGANGTKAKARPRRPISTAPPIPSACSVNSTAAAAGGPVRAGREAKAETRKIFNAERKALQVMGLGPEATLEDVKAKYKALVKQHHPDANGGDRSTEDRLIEIIKAYNYLKTVVRAALSRVLVCARFELARAASLDGEWLDTRESARISLPALTRVYERYAPVALRLRHRPRI